MARVVVIGGGVIGLSCAYYLARRGAQVVVVERATPGAACSAGNLGWVTPSLSEPLPAPGLTWQSIRYMLKRDSPAAGLIDVDVNSVIRIVERIAHGDANLHKVSVHLDLSSDLRTIKGDSVQLQQVILNLMLNAFSAMNGAEIDERRLALRTSSIDKSNVLVEVQDSGTGIAAEKLESIFDPFVTSKPEGLGMGLSICRSIIERHGGKISAANNPDRGATFSITLPVARE